MKSSTSSAAAKIQVEHLLYLQGLIGDIKLNLLISSGAILKVFAKQAMKGVTVKRYIVSLGNGSECYTPSYIDVHGSLAYELKYLVRLH
jgi:hypothetical protein